MSAAAQERHGVDDDQKTEERPEEEAKGNRRFGRAAVRVAVTSRGSPVRRERDGAGKPEDHGDPLDGQGHDAVEESGKVEWRQEEIGQHE